MRSMRRRGGEHTSASSICRASGPKEEDEEEDDGDDDSDSDADKDADVKMVVGAECGA